MFVKNPDSVSIASHRGMLDIPITALPERVIQWMEQGRRGIYDKLLNRGAPSFHASHLPVMVTQNEGGLMPFNCSNKGVGLLPKAEYLQHYLHLFRSTMERTKGKPWQESLSERIKAVSKFYFNRDAIDYRALTTLEIFEKTTYQNLKKNPIAALHYTGNAPDYMSFQVDCAVEVIEPDDPRHEFIKLARVMFEFDSFHIAQHDFPHAYILWVNRVSDKTPFRVPEKANKVAYMPSHDGLEWDADAMDSVNRAPGMIRQFITEQIEKYARRRHFTRITLEVVKEAREVMERHAPEENHQEETQNRNHPIPAPSKTESSTPQADLLRPKAQMGTQSQELERYRSIYVGLDSSPLANAASDLALKMGKPFQSQLHGSHVYAAKMHDNRFRAMEGGLPAEYQKEQELEKQRKIHDNLITKGLELITDSYLESMAKSCETEGIGFTPVSLEGKNWQRLVEDIHLHDYDLIAFGGFGIGRVGRSQIGSVTERTLRRAARDFLIVKRTEEENTGDAIVVCLDGSERSWGGFYRAISLAKVFQKRIIAVSAFDPYFHYAMFKSLNKALTDKARKVFKFEEQEKLHEDIIDSGLAKIYQSYLNIASRLAEKENISIETRLLDGKPFEKILQFTEMTKPWLVVVGRIGFHSEETMDLGSNTENLVRQCEFNLLVAESKAKPPVEYQAEESVAWTVEAKAKMERVPPMARPMATKAIQNYCVAEGHTVVSEAILHEALKAILPPEALERMGIDLTAKKEAEQADLDKIAVSYRCPVCGFVHQHHRPQSCPVCGREGAVFKLIESQEVQNGKSEKTLGDRELMWDAEATQLLQAIPDAFAAEQLRTRIEKRAMTDHAKVVTPQMVQAAQDVSHFEGVSKEASLLWTEKALERLEKVPSGFMRHAAKSTVEKHAREQGQTTITLEVVESGLGRARELMREAMEGKAGHGAAAPGASQTAAPGIASHGTAKQHVVSAQVDAKHWECHLCGLVIDGDAPESCPNCSKSVFMPLSAQKRTEVPAAALGKLHWNSVALERLQRVPEGFMRAMTQWRVEKWARSHGQTEVDFSVMGDKYSSWGEGSEKLTTTMPWSEAALARANRIPGFIRGVVMKEIEKKAKAEGLTSITPAEMEGAMQAWQKSGSFHG
jgi:nucleotide-binding universal stress UspA family protein/rubredoxin